MMNNEITEYMVNLTSDLLGCFGIPTNTAMLTYNKIIMKRAREAREIWLSEFADGKWTAPEDEMVSIIERYLRAAKEGSSRINLRLMARVMKGLAIEQDLVANEFNRWVDIISSLSRDEIIVLATLYKTKNRLIIEKPKFNSNTLFIETKNILVPSFITTDDELKAIYYAIQRTGLIIINTEDKSSNLFNLTTSILMDKLVQLTDFQDALAKEGIEM